MVAGDPKLGFAANFLYTLTGKKPDEVMERAFDIALILHAEHELNASTFAARVTAATLSDIYSAVTSAIGALQGPLHGGANEEVIKLLLEAGTADKALEMIKDKLANKVKIPGFGHRVYHTVDPRAARLKGMAEELGKRTGHQELYQISSQIEKYIKEAKNLNANVDFYSASTYYSLGIPVDLFTPIFAVSRMSGWTAHMLEQYANNRLIRPRAEYMGRPVGQKWVPMAERLVAIGRPEGRPDASMYDLGYFRNNLGRHRRAAGGSRIHRWTWRRSASWIAERRAALTESEQLKAQRNAESQEIGKLKKAGADTADMQQQVREMGELISQAGRQGEGAGRAVPPADGGHPEHAARIGADGQERGRQRRGPALGHAAGIFVSRPRRTGIWGRSWESWISTARRRSRARGSPCTWGWARSWSAR